MDAALIDKPRLAKPQPASRLAKRLLPWRGVLIEPGREPVQHPPRRSSRRLKVEQMEVVDG